MQNLLKKSPIIAAIKNDSALDAACLGKSNIVFLLYGNIFNLQKNVYKLMHAGKRVFVHLEMMEGLKADRQGIRFLKEEVKAFGIISTKPSQIKEAQECGLKTVLRIFMIDASAFYTGIKSVHICKPDLVEMMPGLMPPIIHQLSAQVQSPIVSGGMITEKKDADAALKSGAIAISTSAQSLWNT